MIQGVERGIGCSAPIVTKLRGDNLAETVIGVHKPSLFKRGLAKLGWDVTPEDICPPKKLELLYSLYPFLRGDWTAIGVGDDGNCQSWKNNPGWWKEVLQDDKNASEPFYVFVHSRVAFLAAPNSGVYQKIQEVKKRAQYVEVIFNNTREIMPGTPKGRPIIVGGALRGVCVKDQWEVLNKNGYQAEISEELSVP